MTRHALIACLLATGSLTAACTPSLMTVSKPRAVESAEARAHYDLACAEPKGTIVASEALPPTVAPPPPLFKSTAIPHTRFDVAIAGCGAERKVPVLCSQEEGCFAGAPA
jgi:hypothetical protein